MNHRRLFAASIAVAAIVMAACAPTTSTGGTDAGAALQAPCVQTPPPTVAVVDFENTTGQYGTTVVGVEDAASARLITLLKESGCYVVVERSELLTIMQDRKSVV